MKPDDPLLRLSRCDEGEELSIETCELGGIQ